MAGQRAHTSSALRNTKQTVQIDHSDKKWGNRGLYLSAADRRAAKWGCLIFKSVVAAGRSAASSERVAQNPVSGERGSQMFQAGTAIEHIFLRETGAS